MDVSNNAVVEEIQAVDTTQVVTEVIAEVSVQEVKEPESVEEVREAEPVVEEVKEPEPASTVEEVSNEPSLAQLLLGYLGSPQMKLRMPLDTLLEMQVLLRTHHAWFHDIVDTINKIVADKRIDSRDIPHFMELLQRSFAFLNKKDVSSLVKHKEDMILFGVQLVVQFLIDQGRLELDDQEDCLKLIKALLEQSFHMMRVGQLGKGCSCLGWF